MKERRHMHMNTEISGPRHHWTKRLISILCAGVLVLSGMPDSLRLPEVHASEQAVDCELNEHTHGMECFAEDGTMLCGQQEHTHGEECYAPETAQNAVDEADDAEEYFEAAAQKSETEEEIVLDQGNDSSESFAEEIPLADADREDDQNAARFMECYAKYTDIPETKLPQAKNIKKLAKAFRNSYVEEKNYTPEPGDIVFFSKNPHKEEPEEEHPVYAEIVTEVHNEMMIAIEMEEDEVDKEDIDEIDFEKMNRIIYSLDNPYITGYMSLELFKEAAGIGTETQPDDIVSEPVQESESEPEAVTETENESEPEAITETENESEPEAITEAENESEPEAITEAENESEPEAITETESESEPEVITEAETESESETEILTEEESEEQTEEVTESESETETEAGKYIEITRNEVNLRSAASIEADVIAIVHTGTKLELLNEIEVGDDIWYQVNYTGAIEQSMEEPSTDNEEAFADSEQTADEQNEPEQTEETEALTENAEPEATAEEMEDTAEADAASAEEPVAEASENETEAEQQGIIAYVKSDMTDIAQQEQKSETEQTTLTYDGMDYTVTVSFDEKAGIPENAELVVKEIEQGTEEYENYYRQSLTAMVENSVALNNEEELSVSFARFFDISFLADGEKIEPDASVNVKISYHDAVSFTEDDEVNAVHFADEGTEVLEASAEGENSMEAVSFSQDSFSVTGTLVADMRKSALTYADDELIVKVEEVDQGAIPQGAILKVQPLESGDEDTAQQYKEVGEQLQEKAEEEEYDIAGYLAYDISLVDKDGNEIEPEGQVKVSMDYKEAKIPAEISEDAEVMEPEGAETEAITEETEDTTESELAEDAEPVSVVESTISLQGQMELTVMHLEEDENGGITVVDLSEKEQISELEATEKNEIKGTEFVTDSFSDYTVTWQRWNSNVGIKSYYGKIDNQGRFIPYATSSYALQKIPSQYSDNTYQETNEEIDLANYTNADLFGTCRHIYVSGYIDLSGISNFSQQAMESNVLRLDWEETDRQWRVKYQNSQGNFEVLRRDASGQTIYVFYDCSTEPLEEITTIDNDAFGIKMSMTDYEDHSDDNISDWHEKFLYQRYNGRNYQLGGNYMDANGGMTPGLVKNKLEQGYPVTSNDKPKQEHNLSLRPLFDSRTSANHLLKFDDQGYFVYNSFENYAYYNQTDGNFKVYKQIGTPYARNDNHVTDGDNGNIRLFQRGNFLPYNDIEPGRFASGMTRQRGELDQVLGPATDSRYDEQLYLPNGSINYQFGMYMEVNFVQPENGNKSNGDPMIFEFTGDDDLWVFIDDVLVLDIGGVHEARKGRIDFNTGAVTIENATKNLESDDAVRNTNIKQRFQEAGVSDVLYRENSNTFADYTQHTLKMFYMERGQSASDLHIKFNLQTIPSSTITVSKELAGTDKAEYANETFKYKLEVYMPYNETSTFYSWWWVTPDITNIWSRLNGITITDSVTGAPISFDKYGYFSLRPGQTAILSGEGLTVNLKYRITEIGVDTTKYDEVVATGTTETTTTLNPSEPPKDALSEEETVGNMPKVTFANHVRNPSMLQIKKQMEAGAQVPENDTFNFKIELNDQSGTLVPYRNGKYYLKNANDEYVWIATDGSTCTSSSLKDAQHYGTTDASGQVSGIKAGETIVITGLIAGTNFKVTETDLDSAKYYTPKITVTGCDMPNPATETEKYFGTGTIQANTDAMVTVTNRPKILTRKLRLYKVDSADSTIMLPNAEFNLYKATVTTSENGETVVTAGQEIAHLKSDTDGILKKLDDNTEISEFEYGTYVLRETKAPIGYFLLGQDIILTVGAATGDGAVGSGATAGVAISLAESGNTNMWTITKTSDPDPVYEIKFKNTKLYALPESGSSGTYLFTISGVAVLMTALLLFIRSKKKEEGGYLKI